MTDKTEELLKEPLPDPWTFGVTFDGRVFFINDEKKLTTWLHPDTGEPVRSGFRHRPDLPPAWEEAFTENGQPYYIDHNNETTTFQYPEKVDKKSKKHKKSKRLSKEQPKEHTYQNISDPKEEKKKRRSSSFLSRSGMTLFRRSSSKLRDKPEKYEQPPTKMREKPEKKPKAARPMSATSIRSSQSLSHGKMRVTWRDPNKQITKSGWLYKQDSTGKMRMWRKRWFVLVDFCLYYYKDSKEEEILGNIILPSYTVSTLTPEEKISRKYSFKVEHAGMRSYYFSADSYKDMAEWVTALEKSCSPISPSPDSPTTPTKTALSEDDSSKGDSLKGRKSDSKKKSKLEDDDSEFGFNHVHPPSSVSSHSTKPDSSHDEIMISANRSTNNNKYDPEILQENGRLPSDSYHAPQSPKEQTRTGRVQQKVSSPTRKYQEHYQQQAPPAISQQRTSARRRDGGQDERGRRDAPRSNAQGYPSAHPAHHPGHDNRQQNMHMRQAPTSHQKNVRRENGESAYFSDTSGATDSSRSNTQRGHQNTSQAQVKRQNSLVKLGNWVMTQRMRQQSGSTLNSPQRSHAPTNFDTASEFSSVSQQQPRKSATLSARGPQRTGPPSSRRYRARTYNEYMDPMEVASSTISMPPIQHIGSNRMYLAQNLTRPLSSENMDHTGRPIRDTGRSMITSKSAGNIVAVDQHGAPISPRRVASPQDPNNIKRAKSDFVYQDSDNLQQQYLTNFAKAQKQNQTGFRAVRQQQRSQPRPESGGRTSSDYRSTGSASNSSSGGGLTPRRSANYSTPRSINTPKYNDVFTPRSDASSARSSKKNGQVFHFETANAASSRPNRMLSPYDAVNQNRREVPPTTLALSPTSPNGRNASSKVEVKQIQKGQFTAFVLSARSPQVQLPPPERQIPLKANDQASNRMQRQDGNERDIEAKLKRLNELDRTLQQISDDMAHLQSDKERLEAELSIARSKLQSRYSAGSRESNRQLNQEQHQLEQELENVKAQLSNAAQKLKEMNRENEEFENEIRKLKKRLVEELRSQGVLTDDVYNSISDQDKETKRKLEWELGRVEFMMEGLNKQKQGLVNKLNAFNATKGDDSPLISPISPPSHLSSSSRSPRNVKHASMERRTPQNRPSYSSTSSGGTPNDTPVKKYFTLPGRGISHATSVDSVTAESLMKSTSRPTSARSNTSIASSSNSNLHRTKSAAERLFQSPYTNQGSDYEAKEMKRLQKEIFRNRRNNLKYGTVGETTPRRHSNPTGMTLPTRMKVGIDVQMALKHHRMPKVLQRAKRDMARAEAEKMNSSGNSGFDIDDFDQKVKGHSNGLYDKENYAYENDHVDGGPKEADIEPEPEILVDVNLTHQLIAPDKVEIPERYVEYENVELSPAEEKMKHRKVMAIERMLAKSGQQASLPAVHLAAALAVEAGSVARAVAMHATETHRTPGDGGQKDGSGDRPVTDGSSSAGEEPEPNPSPVQLDPEWSGACIV